MPGDHKTLLEMIPIGQKPNSSCPWKPFLSKNTYGNKSLFWQSTIHGHTQTGSD